MSNSWVQRATLRFLSDACLDFFGGIGVHSNCEGKQGNTKPQKDKELELELTQTHMTQKPMLRVVVGKGRLCGLLSLGDSKKHLLLLCSETTEN
jgi:hypothetical protein